VQQSRALLAAVKTLSTRAQSTLPELSHYLVQADRSLLAGLTDAQLLPLRSCMQVACASFIRKWNNNDFDATLRHAERHAIFVPLSAVELASRNPAVPLFAEFAPADPTHQQLGVPVTTVVLTEWAAYRASVREWARLRAANPSFTLPAAHTFWLAREKIWPNLSQAALRALAVPFCIADAERKFSLMHCIQVHIVLASVTLVFAFFLLFIYLFFHFVYYRLTNVLA
jgi:hypothetical protein